MIRISRPFVAAAALAAMVACGSDGTGPGVVAIDTGPCPQPTAPGALGLGCVAERFTGELNVRGSWAYTTTWGRRGTVVGNAVKVWNVAGARPLLVDTLRLEGATTTGDVQVSDDGRLLVVATERTGGSLAIYGLDDPAHPALITRYTTENTLAGVHTAQVDRVNGRLYAFLSIDPQGAQPSKLVIVDLSDPAHPAEASVLTIGRPFVHDVFVRDGLLFTAEWNDGLGIWDIGGGGRGGSPAGPVRMAQAAVTGGAVHNVWWLHDAAGGKRWIVTGEEQPGVIGSASAGDVHVLDAADLLHPREVAFFHVEGAGTHNFSVNEATGTLYAAYYNAGVRALDLRGDLSACAADQKAADGRCDLARMGRLLGRALDQGDLPQPVYVWGVQYTDGRLFASDMQNGLVRLDPAGLKP
jgi:hypothetical protein